MNTHHYPPELFQLLIGTIPRLFRSKRDVLLFFRGAGVEHSIVSDIEVRLDNDSDSINKFDIVRTVLTRLNDDGEKALRERREILKRVVEFEDFSTCWPDDRLAAQGLVSRIRTVVDVKDSFTKMRQEREAEVRKHREATRNEEEKIRQKRETLAAIRNDFYHLFAMDDDPHGRGLRLEKVLNRLFEANGILVRESFRRISEQGQGAIEQVDGVIEIDGHIYLVEMKWLNKPVGVEDVSQHLAGQSRLILVSGKIPGSSSSGSLTSPENGQLQHKRREFQRVGGLSITFKPQTRANVISD